MFADDIVLFTTDPVSLQAQINCIHDYSRNWGLKINVKKTKICIFEKRRSLHGTDFYINGDKLEKVDNFIYLGINFTYTGTLTGAVKRLYEQGLKAYYSLLKVLDRVSLDVKTQLRIFDTMITPILLYGAEVWGVYNYKDIDKLHMRFCKRVLNVRKCTPNYAVYGELGRLPLSVIAKERAVKFWLKIMNNADAPGYDMYIDATNNIRGPSWAGRLNSIIDHLGYSEIRHTFDIGKNYFPELKCRLRDQFIQEWNTSINGSSKLHYYVKYKHEFEYEDYLDKITNDSLRICLTRFRLSSHNLEIELGRYQNIIRENRLCKLCTSNQTETEFHFLLSCPKYSEIRKQYFGTISWPTMSLFKNIVSTKNRKKLFKLCKYLKDAFSVRENTLTT